MKKSTTLVCSGTVVSLLALTQACGPSEPTNTPDVVAQDASSGVDSSLDGAPADASDVPSLQQDMRAATLAISCANQFNVRFQQQDTVSGALYFGRAFRAGMPVDEPVRRTVLDCTLRANTCADLAQCLRAAPCPAAATEGSNGCVDGRYMHCAFGRTMVLADDCAATGDQCTANGCATNTDLCMSGASCRGNFAVNCIDGVSRREDCSRMIAGGVCAMRNGRAECRPSPDPCQTNDANRCEGGREIRCTGTRYPYGATATNCSLIGANSSCTASGSCSNMAVVTDPLGRCEGNDVVVTYDGVALRQSCTDLGYARCIVSGTRGAVCAQ